MEVKKLYDVYGSVFTKYLDLLSYPGFNLWWILRYRIFFDLFKNSIKGINTIHIRVPSPMKFKIHIYVYVILIVFEAIIAMILQRILFSSLKSSRKYSFLVLIPLADNLYYDNFSKKLYTKYYESLILGLHRVSKTAILYVNALSFRKLLYREIVNVFKLNNIFRRKINILSLFDIISPHIIPAYLLYVKLLIRKTLHRNSEFLTSVIYKYRKDILLGYLYYIAYTSFFDKIKTKAIIFKVSYNTITTPLIVLSNSLNITTIEFQHGNIIGVHPGYYYNDKMSISLKKKAIPSVFLVFGQHFIKILINSGFNSKFIPAGDIRYIYYMMLARRISRRKNIGRKMTILITTQKLSKNSMQEEFIEKILLAIHNSAKQNIKKCDIDIVIKPHPIESYKFYKNIIDKISNKNREIKSYNVTIAKPNEDILYYILKSDILISLYSTTILEAIYLGKLSLIFNIITKEKSNAIFKLEKIPIANNYIELYSILSKLLCNEEMYTSLSKIEREAIFDVYNTPNLRSIVLNLLNII